MKILITGANGFIGRNLIEKINRTIPDATIFCFDVNDSLEDLESFCKECDFVFNFAAVHRPVDRKQFFDVNTNQFSVLLSYLEKYNNNCPVLYTSSIQSNNGSDYGRSKYLGERLLFEYGKKTGARSIVYRLTNVFGRWARPNSHSVVATFCYNVLNNIPLYVSDPSIEIHFVYIDDVIDSFLKRIEEGSNRIDSDENIYSFPDDKIISISLGDLSELISSFKNRKSYIGLSAKERLFYKTYLSYKNHDRH